MAEVGQQNSTAMIPTMEVVTVDDFTFGYENGEAYILFQKNMQPKTLSQEMLKKAVTRTRQVNRLPRGKALHPTDLGSEIVTDFLERI